MDSERSQANIRDWEGKEAPPPEAQEFPSLYPEYPVYRYQRLKLEMLAHTCDPSTEETDAELP